MWIDEIELHMHPSWQRMVLSVLRKTFPNIQFIVTKHSLQALGKVDNEYNVYMLMNEEYMETGSFNPAFQDLRCRASDAIENNDLDTAECLIGEVKQIVGPNNATVFKLEGHLKRGWLLYAKN
mgnify:FL=1